MANEQDRNQNPTTGSESDISKAQSQQQPPQQASQRSETGQQSGQFETGQQGGSELTGDQAATGQSQSGTLPDDGSQGDTLAQQRTDIEGGSLGSQQSGQAASGFVGSESDSDTSSELVEDQDFSRDGQGATDEE